MPKAHEQLSTGKTYGHQKFERVLIEAILTKRIERVRELRNEKYKRDQVAIGLLF